MPDAGFEYTPRNAEATVLYRVVAEELETFLARQQERDHPVPRFVEREFRSFLDCGVLARGFLRLRCQSCGQDRKLLFPIGKCEIPAGKSLFLIGKREILIRKLLFLIADVGTGSRTREPCQRLAAPGRNNSARQGKWDRSARSEKSLQGFSRFRCPPVM